MKNAQLKAYALTLGVEITTYDCKEIRATAYTGETIPHAVIDYLDAVEGCYISEEERNKAYGT
jgi:hypothetical protein